MQTVTPNTIDSVNHFSMAHLFTKQFEQLKN